MALERVAGNAQEDIDQPIVADTSQDSLLVIESVLGDYSWSGIRHFRDCKVWVGSQRYVGDQYEPVFAPSCGADDPGFSGRRSCQNAGRELRPVPEAVDQVSQVLGEVDAQFRCGRDDILPLEGYLALSALVLRVKDRL